MPKPRTMSATSITVFQQCPARWIAEYYLRAGQPSSGAADLGTACHGALENFVKAGLHTDTTAVKALLDFYHTEYYRLFPTDEQYEDGVQMLKKWFARTVPLEHEVLSTESKLKFEVPTSLGPVPFNYIMDRKDLRPDGSIEVVDYKSIRARMNPDDLRNNIQARCYALAAQMEHKDAPRVWVTFDLLRHDAIGTSFSRDENVATWKYIKSIAARIIDTDGNKPHLNERLNINCAWCVRKTVCKALNNHVEVGGVLGLDANQAAQKRAELAQQKKGLEVVIDELDKIVLAHAEAEDILEWEVEGGGKIEITAQSRRKPDPAMVEKIIGPELFAKYGRINVGDIDALLKGDEITTEQKSLLRQSIGRIWGSPSVKYTEPNPIDE